MIKGARAIEVYIAAAGVWRLGDGGWPEIARVDPDFIWAADGKWFSGLATPVDEDQKIAMFKIGEHRAIYRLCGFTSSGDMLMQLSASVAPVTGLRFFTYDEEMRKKCEVWLNERENQDAKS